MRLLVVEDEQKVSSFISKGLQEEGYAVDVAFDGKTGLQMAMDQVHDLIVMTNIIDVYVNYLRRKIDSDREPKLIHTVRGVGYVLKEE